MSESTGAGISNAELAAAEDSDEMDCFGATKPILALIFLLWGGLMFMSAFTTT